MPNNSADPGYLTPVNPPPSPTEDDALVDVLQEVVAGITGLSGNLIFPRWQANPPTLPAFGTNWAALGIVNRSADTFAAVVHRPTANNGDGADDVVRNEEIDLLVTFYGPNCNSNATLLREGLQVWQNRAALRANDANLIEVSDLTRAPELIQSRWYDRVDMTVRVRRQVTRRYNVLNLKKAQGTITANPPGERTIDDNFITEEA